MSELAVILGLSGPRLTEGEKAFFRDANPWGFILFARNVETPQQVRALTDSLRDCVGRDCLIFIDQEGGRVQRLRPPHWPAYESYQAISHDKELVFLHHRLIAEDLNRLGINADCAPVLDIPVKGADPIISDRAFGSTAEAVIEKAHAAMAGLLEGGIAPVIKHIPGHGRAKVDSHKALPRITSKFTTLQRTDFAPFKAFNDAPMAMTAHAVFEAVDKSKPLTLSKKAIDIIVRGEIGFDGLLMSDDLDMKALSGRLKTKTEQSLKAGCDIALQCSGKLPDMVEVAKGAHTLSGKAKTRADIAYLCAQPAARFDYAEAKSRYHDALPHLRAAL